MAALVIGESASADRGRTLRLALFGATVVGLLAWTAYIVAFPLALDAHAYYAADLRHLYGGREGDYDTFVYSPAFAQAIEPLRWAGWDAFRTVWRFLELGALTAFVGPAIGLMLFVQPVAGEINLGNIDLLLAAAVVAGFRWPATWSFVLLTKVTPGIGLLWFVVRREWRQLGIALGATVAIVAVSFALSPAAWIEWITSIAGQQQPSTAVFITAPLVARLVAGAALVIWGAPHDQRWTVLVAALVTLPVVWSFAAAMLTALPLLVRQASSASSTQRTANVTGLT